MLLVPPLLVLGEPPCEEGIRSVGSAEHAKITERVARAQDCTTVERIGMIPNWYPAVDSGGEKSFKNNAVFMRKRGSETHAHFTLELSTAGG